MCCVCQSGICAKLEHEMEVIKAQNLVPTEAEAQSSTKKPPGSTQLCACQSQSIHRQCTDTYRSTHHRTTHMGALTEVLTQTRSTYGTALTRALTEAIMEVLTFQKVILPVPVQVWKPSVSLKLVSVDDMWKWQVTPANKFTTICLHVICIFTAYDGQEKTKQLILELTNKFWLFD